MYRTIFVGFFQLLFTLLSGCSAENPLQALENRGQQLQQALENKSVSQIKALLHSDFQLKNGEGLDWVERTLRLAFLRHKNIRVVVLRQNHALDNSYQDRASSQADIAISGAEGWIPERAGHYQVQLQWQLEDGEWQLHRLHWQ